MTFYIKYDLHSTLMTLLQEQINSLQLNCVLTDINKVVFNEKLSDEKLEELKNSLKKYKIEIITDPKTILIQKIKDVITEMVYFEDNLPNSKTSVYLSEKLDLSYNYMSKIFSELTYTSIENFIILQKIERAKELLILNELNITEIAWKLNYSSTAHFSNQFKNVTGLNPTAFKRIINKKHEAFYSTNKNSQTTTNN